MANDNARASLQAQFLMFSLGVNEHTGLRPIFGLDAFQVREVLRTPPITQMPRATPGVRGMVSLRGAILPVLALQHLLDIPAKSGDSILIVAEIQGRDVAFLVDAVDTIVRLERDQLLEPPQMLANSHLSAVVQLENGNLLQVLDMPSALDRWFPVEVQSSLFGEA